MTEAPGAYAAFDEFESAGGAAKDAAHDDDLVGRVTARVAEPLLGAVGVGAGGRLLVRGSRHA